MKPVESVSRLAALLRLPGVVEEFTARSNIGICALHGGGLERTTDVIAKEVAQRAGASYYGVTQPEGSRHHLSSTRFNPDNSPLLTAFLERVEYVVSIHGYGRENNFFTILLGGRNRPFAHHLAKQLRATLPKKYRIIDDLCNIPQELRGIHPENPVNLTRHEGVQIELPPAIRWNSKDKNWSDEGDTSRVPQLASLVEALTEGVASWQILPEQKLCLGVN